MFERKIYLEKIGRDLQNTKILFLIGARQVGKTSILLSLGKFLGIKKYSFISFDDYINIDFISSTDFLDFIYKKSKSQDFEYILLDEVQNIYNIGILLKGVYDKFKRENKKIKIIASGSGSIEIFRGITDSLIGRKTIINIYPLSFLEFLEYREFDVENLDIKKIKKWEIDELMRYLGEFLNYGSYPEVVFTKNLEEKFEILNGIYKDYIYKDISFYLRTEEIISFDKFLKYIGGCFCSSVKIDKIARDIGIGRRLVEKFIFLVENTFILNFVPAFTKNKQKEISKSKKVYFTDLGFLRKVLGISNIGFENKGKFIENFVFLELLKYKSNLESIFYYQKKNGSEIDFVIENEFLGDIIPIEVKTSSTSNIPIIFKSFFEDYKGIIKKFYLINKDIIKTRNLQEKEVCILSYLVLFKEFLKEKKDKSCTKSSTHFLH